jgi:hypothetical protein
MFGGNPVGTAIAQPVTPPPASGTGPSGIPDAPHGIPDAAYTLPDPDTESLNAEYWRGYRAGMAARGIVPSPAGVTPDQYGNGWQPYFRTRVAPLYRPDSLMGSVIAGNVGYNDAIQAGAIYRYHHEPQSPYFVAS